MAIITLGPAASPFVDYTKYDFGDVITGTVTSKSLTEWVVDVTDGSNTAQVTVGGFGILDINNDDIPDFGTINSISTTLNGSDLVSITDFSVTVLDIVLAVASDTEDELLADTFSGTHTVTGSVGAELLVAYNGNNLMLGNGGSDWMIGGSGSDTLFGGAGGDWMDGGGGFDVASYAGAAAGVTAILDSRYAFNNKGEAAGDGFSNVEALIGTAFDDILAGDRDENTLWGEDGDDLLLGLDGRDNLVGGDGDDTLNGGDGNRDVLDGGEGSDTASYFILGGAVTASLANPGSNTGRAQGDRYVSIENLQGSGKADQLTGDGGNNVLSGLGGDDTLNGQGGDDTLIGGSRADILIGGGGFDYASYESSFGVRAVLLDSLSRLNNGDARQDTFQNIEGLIGSSGEDILVGDNNANHLIGGDGSDWLFGWDGNDSLDGGAGNDSLFGGEYFIPNGFGDDRFSFSTGHDQDKIFGFDTGADSDDVLLLDLGTNFDTFAEVQGAATDVGGNTLLSFGGGDSILLIGVTSTSLHQDDFMFA